MSYLEYMVMTALALYCAEKMWRWYDRYDDYKRDKDPKCWMHQRGFGECPECKPKKKRKKRKK